MKELRVKKDVILYHPIHIKLKAGSIIMAKDLHSVILVRDDNIIMTDVKEMEEYLEELPDDEELRRMTIDFLRQYQKLLKGELKLIHPEGTQRVLRGLKSIIELNEKRLEKDEN